MKNAVTMSLLLCGGLLIYTDHFLPRLFVGVICLSAAWTNHKGNT